MNFEISILSFLVCICTGSLLARISVFDFLKTRAGRFETLDGLRGFLAVSVFFHHFVVTYYWKVTGQWERPVEAYYQNYGRVGVAIFFMITGFVFISKILKSKGQVNWLKLYESRFFRIYPLYIFLLALITIVVIHNSNYKINSSSLELIKQYVWWILFQGEEINNYAETRTVIAGVDWTLKYEWLFYILLPIISFIICKGNKYTNCLLFAVIAFYAVYPVTFMIYPNADFSTKLFLLFAIGGGMSWVLNSKAISVDIIKSKTVSLITLMLFFGSILYPKTYDVIHIIIMSLFFSFVVLGNDLFGLFRLNATKLLGEISYSIYLLHGFILYVLFTQLSLVDIQNMTPQTYEWLMPVVSIVLVLVSAATYICIEKPFIDLGRKYLLSSGLSSLIKVVKKVL